MKFILLNVIVILSVLSCATKAQSVTRSERLDIFVVVAPDDTTDLFGRTNFLPNTKVLATVFVSSLDTLNISGINIKLGSSSGGSDLFEKFFVFSQTGNLSDGTSLLIRPGCMYAMIGNYTGLNNYYVEARLKYRDGSWADALYYHK